MSIGCNVSSLSEQINLGRVRFEQNVVDPLLYLVDPQMLFGSELFFVKSTKVVRFVVDLSKNRVDPQLFDPQKKLWIVVVDLSFFCIF